MNYKKTSDFEFATARNNTRVFRNVQSKASRNMPGRMATCMEKSFGMAVYLRTECLRSRKIHAVIVAQVIVRYDGGGLDASTDQEIDQHRLHFGLPGLEVIPTNQDALLDLQLQSQTLKDPACADQRTEYTGTPLQSVAWIPSERVMFGLSQTTALDVQTSNVCDLEWSHFDGHRIS